MRFTPGYRRALFHLRSTLNITKKHIPLTVSEPDIYPVSKILELWNLIYWQTQLNYPTLPNLKNADWRQHLVFLFWRTSIRFSLSVKRATRYLLSLRLQHSLAKKTHGPLLKRIRNLPNYWLWLYLVRQWRKTPTEIYFGIFMNSKSSRYSRSQRTPTLPLRGARISIQLPSLGSIPDFLVRKPNHGSLKVST